MASKSPQNENKKRKQPVVGLKRDQQRPPFGSRRLQQPPILETESLLDTSNNLSPSPIKENTRPLLRPQHRQTFSAGRSLAAAYNATPQKNDENQPPSSASSSDRTRHQQSLKPRPLQAKRPQQRPASQPPAEKQARLRTPSPASPERGRQQSYISPSSSASSPPRGLAEAYQRIVDEENLAQDESMENIDQHGYQPQSSIVEVDDDRPNQKASYGVPSPSSLKASRRTSPHPISGSSAFPQQRKASVYGSPQEPESDVTKSVQEDTTEFSGDFGPSQHAKDVRRVNGVLKNDRPFRKALVGDRVGLTVENLRRRNGSSDSLGSAFGGSVSSRGSDPSVNIPRQWGRKAKPGKDWLSRINSSSGRFTGDIPQRRSPARNTESHMQHDERVSTAADIPLPSGEDCSSQAALSSHSSTPTVAPRRNQSLDRVLDWDVHDDDFTGRSLQMSDSPPIRIQNTTLDRILEKEIESVAKKAVTTSRLGELRENRSKESIQTTGSGTSRRSSDHSNNDRSDFNPKFRHLSDSQTATPGPLQTHLGEAIPDTPVVVYRSDSSGSRGNGSEGSANKSRHSGLRPKPQRQDSHGLLKQLAQATSSSPSPIPEPEDVRKPIGPPMSERVDQSITEDQRDSNLDMKHQASNHDRDQLLEPAPKIEDRDKNTPQPLKSNAYIKTPRAMGAWIDTPFPTGGRGPPLPTPETNNQEAPFNIYNDSQVVVAPDLIRRLSPHTMQLQPSDEELKQTAPKLPKSALESIISAAKARLDNHNRPARSTELHLNSEEDATLLLGDSTIHSLEELLDNGTASDMSLQPDPATAATRANDDSMPQSSKELPLEDDANPPTSTLQLYARQLSRLNFLLPSLRETRAGIASLERSISAPTSLPTSAKSSPLQLPQREKKECTEAGEFHDFISPCQTCGCPGPSSSPFSSSTITIPIPTLWRRSHSRQWLPRPTGLGALVLLACVYWIAELWAQDTYCHKYYASSMVGYGVDIHAPKRPFVLVKVVLGRWLALGNVLKVLVKVAAGVTGWAMGFVAGDGGGGGRAGGSSGTGTGPGTGRGWKSMPMPSWGPDLSMMDDEVM
ncbi:MAG: hypothetical protein Q9214_003624 [Letrouitia sp. 1 TL-2023]